MSHVEGELRPRGANGPATWRVAFRPTRSLTPPPGDPGLPDDSRESEEIDRAKGDPNAFGPLYERYVDAVFGYCYRRTSDRELAADLTSQIFTQALAALPRYRPGRGAGTFRSWLFSIAHNLVIDTHRTRRTHASTDSDAGRSIRDFAPSPEEHALAGERRRELAEALGQLTGGQRQIVELRLAGLTGPEIAAVLGMQLAAVKSGQFRAYSRLRGLLRHLVDDHESDPGSPPVLQEPSDA